LEPNPWCSSTRALASNCVINDEHNYRADRSYHDARQVHAGNSDKTKFGENRVPDDSPQPNGTCTFAVGDDVTQLVERDERRPS
jgi:hypothetical protein